MSEEVLIASLVFNGITTFAIVIILWRYCKLRRCCLLHTDRTFSKIEEKLPDEHRLRNGEHVKDYASVKQARTSDLPAVKPRSEEEDNINSLKTHSYIASDTKTDGFVIENEETCPKPASNDWDNSASSTILDIEETNIVVGEQTEVFEEKPDDCDDSKTDDPIIIIDQTSNDLDQQTEKEFEEAFDKRHKDSVIETIEKTPMTVQVLSKADIPIIGNATEELMSKLNFSDTVLKYTHIQDIAGVNAEDPLLIICAHTSRLGTDATNAVKGLLHPKSTALLILHHQEKHALPVNRSDRILVDSKFDEIGGIFDFAYRSETGMYSCQMNTVCIEELATFIRECQNS